MITFDKEMVRLVQRADELPEPPVGGVNRMYMDHETNSFTHKRGGDNPWGGDRICGTALTWDGNPWAYYVPVRHTHAHWNIPLESFQRWHADWIRSHRIWSNQNVKFDAHFSAQEPDPVTGGRCLFRGELFDTLNNAKMIDSDRGFGRGGYGLDALFGDWVADEDEEVDVHDQSVQAYLLSLRPKSKNYADVPADILGVYAGLDVHKARRLEMYELAEHDRIVAEQPNFDLIWGIEQRLTPVLFDMEDHGLRVNQQELQVTEFMILTELMQLQEQLHKLTDFPVEPSNSADCFELLCNRYGLPVLSWTEEKMNAEGRIIKEANPSFDKDALKHYLMHPVVSANELLTKVVTLMMRYRKRHTLLTFFVRPFLLHQVNGIMHPQYNQLIRTGRMSCKRPNSQQNNAESKALIHPDPGCAYLSTDASQIEFRLMVHYSQDQNVIDAYARDPDTDFHQWVAEMVGIPRKPAKNVNFCIGYGGGKKKVLTMLSSSMDLMGSLGMKVDELITAGRIEQSRRQEAFTALCRMRAEDVYRQYHDTLPGIRRVTDKAAKLAKATGYVFNFMGRRRHMPEKAAWRSFNSLTQGGASDLIKYGMVTMAPRYNDWTRSQGIDLRINVHDDLVWHGEAELMRDPDTVRRIVEPLEAPPVKLRVPIRFAAGWSDKTWAGASSDGGKLTIQRTPRLEDRSFDMEGGVVDRPMLPAPAGNTTTG
jgi:DNA polymerase-1